MGAGGRGTAAPICTARMRRMSAALRCAPPPRWRPAAPPRQRWRVNPPTRPAGSPGSRSFSPRSAARMHSEEMRSKTPERCLQYKPLDPKASRPDQPGRQVLSCDIDDNIYARLSCEDMVDILLSVRLNQPCWAHHYIHSMQSSKALRYNSTSARCPHTGVRCSHRIPAAPLAHMDDCRVVFLVHIIVLQQQRSSVPG